MRKVILVDIYLAYNLGDDMFLDHLASHFPNVDFVPFHPGKNYRKFFENYENIKQFSYGLLDKIKSKMGRSKLKDYESLAADYDGLLFLGGGIFREESYWREVFDYRENILNAFRDVRKPVWYAGCSFGPYASDEFLDTYTKHLKKVNKITFRDRYSFELFQNLSSVFYAPDVLWSYPLPKVSKEERHLGISVIDPRHKQGLEYTFDNYVAAHRKIIDKYLALNFRVTLFAFCAKEGDTEVAEMILRDKANVSLEEYRGNIKTYLQRLGTCTHFIAARFHANIIAMKYGQKLIPVIYGDKTKYLLSDLEIKGVDLENIEAINHTSFIMVDNALIKKNTKNSKTHLDIAL